MSMRWRASHHILKLIFHFLTQISCFSYHFPCYQTEPNTLLMFYKNNCLWLTLWMFCNSISLQSYQKAGLKISRSWNLLKIVCNSIKRNYISLASIWIPGPIKYAEKRGPSIFLVTSVKGEGTGETRTWKNDGGALQSVAYERLMQCRSKYT